MVQSQVHIQRLTIEMTLEKQVRLGLGLVEIVGFQCAAIFVSSLEDRVGGELRKLAEQWLLTISDWNLCELSCFTQDSDQCLHSLGQNLFILKFRRKETNSLVLDPVEGSDDAEVDWFNVHFCLFIDLDALGVLQVLHGVFDQLRQEVVNMLSSSSIQVVVVRIRGQSPVQERPGHPIDSVLLACNSADNNLSVEGVVQVLSEVRLDREWLLEELNEIVTSGCVAHEETLRGAPGTIC